MLSEASYHVALALYLGAGLLAALWLGWCVRRWGRGWSLLLIFLGAALLLTPAYPRDGVDTLAPAVVVAGFLLLTDGWEAAQHALRPLAATCSLAIVLALLLRLTLLRPRHVPAREVAAAAEGSD